MTGQGKDTTKIGPMQQIAVAFDNDENLRGQIRRELDAVQGRGLIKLMDALFVVKDDAREVMVVSGSGITARKSLYLHPVPDWTSVGCPADSMLLESRQVLTRRIGPPGRTGFS